MITAPIFIFLTKKISRGLIHKLSLNLPSNVVNVLISYILYLRFVIKEGDFRDSLQPIKVGVTKGSVV